MVQCFVLKELELTAKEIAKRKAVSKNVKKSDEALRKRVVELKIKA